jgi:hypothetical protein
MKINIKATLHLLLVVATQANAVSLVSGAHPIVDGDTLHWWIENNSACSIKLETWVSSENYQQVLPDISSSLSNNQLNKKQRSMLTLKNHRTSTKQIRWINIYQESYCSLPRLTRIKL